MDEPQIVQLIYNSLFFLFYLKKFNIILLIKNKLIYPLACTQAYRNQSYK